MTPNIKICSTLLLLLFASIGIAQKKTFTKVYPLNNGQEVSLNNKYGDIKIITWNRNEVKVDATISVFSNNTQTANSLLNTINIESRDGDPVSFVTKMQGSISNSKRNTSIQIDYLVYMPSSHPLSVKNQFGATLIPDWEGDVNIDQSYGEIETGTLSSGKSINVSFGGLSSKAINNGNLKISYSNLSISKLSGSVNTKIDFCSAAKIGLEGSLEKLEMHASYSDVILQVSPAVNAFFQIKTSYADLINKSKLPVNNETKENKYGPTFDKVYSINSGSGKGSVRLNSSFGNITIK